MTHDLVLGGAGFIGRHLTAALLFKDHQVTVVDDFSTAAPISHEYLEAQGARVIVADVADGFGWDEPVDTVWMLASPASPTAYWRYPIKTLKTNSLGTHNAVDIAAEYDANLVLVSSSEIYGDPQEHPQPETYPGYVSPTGPRSQFAEAKRYAEAYAWAHRDMIPVRIARIFNTYGPWQLLNDGRVLPAFLQAIQHAEPIPIHGTGLQTRSFCYVGDTARGLVELADYEQSAIFNIGNTDEITILGLAEEVVALTGHLNGIDWQPARPSDPKRRKPDITAAERELGWKPQIRLTEGLERTLEWVGFVGDDGYLPD